MTTLKIFKIRNLFLFGLILGTIVQISQAASVVSSKQAQEFIQHTAHDYKISPEYIRYLLGRAQYLPHIIEAANRPKSGNYPWNQYEAELVTEEKIADGVKFWDATNKLLAWQKKEYGIPSEIIVAIIGIESNYGKQMGKYRAIDALATLAFHYPPREKFYQNELGAFMALAKTLNRDPLSFKGSYAGALGMPQFMPSSYLYYSVDFQNKKFPDLFSDKADVIFSIGNFLRQKGWEPGEPIAMRPRISGNGYLKLLEEEDPKPTKPKFSLAAISKFGVIPAGFADERLKAQLVALPSYDETSYWLTFNNFYIIKKYNNSNYYAMAVFELAQKIRSRWDANHKKVEEPEENHQTPI